MSEEMDFSAFSQNTQFDDVLPEDIRVSIVEFIDEETEVDGRVIKRRRPSRRTASISTYVPMKVFHRMMASQEKVRRFQMMKKQGDQIDPAGQQVMLEWMTAQVAAVWQLTEPDMTEEKISEGLSFQKIMGLFGLFFGDQLKSLAEQGK
jgi:hypothetical protein